jgi:hypothetical protein
MARDIGCDPGEELPRIAPPLRMQLMPAFFNFSPHYAQYPQTIGSINRISGV